MNHIDVELRSIRADQKSSRLHHHHRRHVTLAPRFAGNRYSITCAGTGIDASRRASADRRQHFRRKRNLSRPNRQRVVSIVVERIAASELRRCLHDWNRQNRSGGQLLLVGMPNMIPAAGRDVIDQTFHHADLFSRVGDQLRRAENHHRAVVDRMMERGSREHQAVDMRHRNRYRRSLGRRTEHSARSRSVNIKPVGDADVKRGNHVGLRIDREANVANQRGVEDRVDGVAIVGRALGQTLYASARSGRNRVFP